MKIWKTILCFFGICKKEVVQSEEVKKIVINPTESGIATPEEILFIETPKEETIPISSASDDSMKELEKMIVERKKEIKPKKTRPKYKQYKQNGNSWNSKKGGNKKKAKSN
jgi:hypothetical protein